MTSKTTMTLENSKLRKEINQYKSKCVELMCEIDNLKKEINKSKTIKLTEEDILEREKIMDEEMEEENDHPLK